MSISAPHPQSIDANGRTISIPTGLFIGGSFVYAKAEGSFAVKSPASQRTIAQIQEAQKEDVDEAVLAARAAFERNPDAWSQSDPSWRGQLLNKLADLLERDAADVVAIEMLDTGKTYFQASAIDFPSAVSTVRYFAGFADKLAGDSSFNIPGCFAYTRREPVGVCGLIIPWNFPLVLLLWKLAPALACGCTVVAKSAEAAPLSALKVAELVQETGFPPGTVNVLSGFGKTAGHAIAHHMDIDKIAFTGSTATGRSILKAAASSNLKPVTLELGGKSPCIIFSDADLEKTVEWCAFGINLNFGQTCHAGTRIYVHEDVYDEFLAAFTKRLSKATIGDNFAPQTTQGPQNSKMQYDKILKYIELGKEEGANVHLGGKRVGSGYYVEPTIFTNVTPDMKIMREEIFGPVVAIAMFSTEAEALQLANATSYGLAAAVHTKDYERAVRVTSALKAGTTWVNMYSFVHHSMPFGGFKESGFGKELGAAGLEAYTKLKSVFWNMGISAPSI